MKSKYKIRMYNIFPVTWMYIYINLNVQKTKPLYTSFP